MTKTPQLNDMVRVKVARDRWVDGTITYYGVGGIEDPHREGYVSVSWDDGDYSQHVDVQDLTWDQDIEGWRF